jgi:hypothetical protein
MLGSFCGVFALFMLLGLALDEVYHLPRWLGLSIVFLGAVLGLVFVAIVYLGMLRPSHISEDTITLKGVSPEFEDALEDWRRSVDNLERERRERIRR